LLPSKVFLKLARVYVEEVGVKVMAYLLRKGEATDEDIAKALSLPISEVRKVLYIFSDKAIISSRMERDVNTGWITYYWYVPLDQLEGILYNIKRRVLERLEKKLDYESTNVFYWCGHREKHCSKVTFSQAVDELFRCPTCGAHLKPYDNSDLIAALNWSISKLKSELREHFAR
jgi:transcription initiation factor TFIIE subunit alpha